jgi:hypothetical protein
MSAASMRDRFMFGIFAWGSRRNVVRPDSLKFGRLAISAKGGASAFASLIARDHMACGAPPHGQPLAI